MGVPLLRCCGARTPRGVRPPCWIACLQKKTAEKERVKAKVRARKTKTAPRLVACLQGGLGGGPPFEAIRADTHKYVEYESGEKELYDLQADPYELDNIYETTDPAPVQDLKTKLDALESCTGAGCWEAEDGP